MTGVAVQPYMLQSGLENAGRVYDCHHRTEIEAVNDLNLPETVRIDLDGDGRLAGYSLARRVDGKEIDVDTALLELIRGATAAELLRLDAASVRRREPISGSAGAAVNLKHLFAIQATLQMWRERIAAADEDPCRIAGVRCVDERTAIEALVNLNQIAANIIATGSFRGG